MDVVFLSRLQFFITIGFHYIFPPMSMGLVIAILFIEGMYLKTKDDFYKKLAQFWIKVFALFFALGVATGLVQLFAFGNNWSRFSVFVGDVFGSILAAEGIFAFFLEAGFLGIMLFGWDRVKPRTHFMATFFVGLGAHFSAIWILIANSWMQTPAGFKVVGEGIHSKAVITSLYEVIFNPSSIDRIVHTVIGAWLTGAFFLISVGAYYILKKKHREYGEFSLKMGLISAFVLLLLQLVSADSTARGVAKHQPAKLAAMEGVYETKPYTPLTALGYVDTKEQKVVGIQVPGLLSFLVYRNFETPVKGLNEIPKENWPNVQIVFQSYHIMIMCWGAMITVAGLGLYLLKKKKLMTSPFILWPMVFSVVLPYIANYAGWITAECGRQPWVVYNVLRTENAASPSVAASQVIGSLIMFSIIYTILFSLFIFLLNRKIQDGPEVFEGDSIYANPFDD